MMFSPIVRQFKKIDIGEFRRVEDTRDCIRKPLEKLGMQPEEIFDFETYRDVAEIHNLSGGDHMRFSFSVTCYFGECRQNGQNA